MEDILLLAAGAIIGGLASSIRYWRKRTSGTLRIDHSNPEKDIYRFEVNEIENLSRKKEIILKIDNNADLSPK
jgi:hypothetical protein